MPCLVDFVNLCHHGQIEKDADLSRAEVVIDHACGSDQIDEFIHRHIHFLVGKHLAPRINTVDLLQRRQVLLVHCVTLLGPKPLGAEVTVSVVLEVGEHILLKELNDGTFESMTNFTYKS